MSGYIKIFKDEGGDNNKLMSFRIDEAKLLKNYKAIWNRIKDLQNIELDGLPVYDIYIYRYIYIYIYIYIYKTKIRTYGDNVYINVRDSNVPEDVEEWNILLISIFESFVSHFY